MIYCKLKCLSCGENLGISVNGEGFFILCSANDRCPEKEDQNLIEERFCGRGFSKGQFRILEKYIGFRVPLSNLKRV